MKNTCKDCRFFVLFAPDEPNSFGDGECYRFPPSSSNKQEDTGCEEELFIRPTVHGRFGWCGEFSKVLLQDANYDEFDFSVRAMRAIERMGYPSIQELVEMSEVSMLGVRNCGIFTIDEIKGKIKQFNLNS